MSSHGPARTLEGSNVRVRHQGAGVLLRRSKIVLLGIVALSLLGVLVASRWHGGPPRLAAVVAGDEVRSEEVERLVKVWSQRKDKESGQAQGGAIGGPEGGAPPGANPPETRGEAAKSALVYLIRVTFLEHLARQYSISTELGSAEELMVEAMPDDGFAQSGWEKRDYRRGVTAGVLSKRIAERVFGDLIVPENELRAFFEGNKKQFESSWQANIEIAYFDQEPSHEQVTALLHQEPDFEPAMRRIGAREAGPLSGVGPLAPLPKPLLDVVSALAQGEFSRPFRVGSGWVVVLVTRRTDIGARDFEAAKADISTVVTNRRRQELFGNWFDEQLAKTRVEVHHYGRWQPEYQLVE